LKSKEKFGSWLARICRNVAKDMIKKKLRGIDTENLLPLRDGGNDEQKNQAVKQAIADQDKKVIQEKLSKINANCASWERNRAG